MSTILSGIGLRLREVRRIYDLTQPVMATQAEVSDRTYKDYEMEKRPISAEAAAKISREFDIDLNWLLLGEGKMEKQNSEQPKRLIEDSLKAVLLQQEMRELELSPERVSKILSFVLVQAENSGRDPSTIAEEYFATI